MSYVGVGARFNIQIAKTSIEMGIPAIVEKPPGSPSELKALAEKAKRKGVQLFTLYHSACNPGLTTIVNWVKHNSDKIKEVKVTWCEALAP